MSEDIGPTWLPGSPTDEESLKAWHRDHSDKRKTDITHKIYLLLAEASEGTIEADRAMDIAKRAVAEATNDQEEK